jgi:hypothetical protein
LNVSENVFSIDNKELPLKGMRVRTFVLRVSRKVKKVKFALEQAMKTQRGSRGIVLLFL